MPTTLTNPPAPMDHASIGEMPLFRPPSAIERFFNRVYGLLVGLGAGPRYNQLLEVTGRRSGRLYSTPVNVMLHEGALFLVCPRGRAQWVRNAQAAGNRITLRRGRRAQQWMLREVPTEQRAPLLAEYLSRYVGAVQRYFSVQAGSPVEAFAAIAVHHPVFELRHVGDRAGLASSPQ